MDSDTIPCCILAESSAQAQPSLLERDLLREIQREQRFQRERSSENQDTLHAPHPDVRATKETAAETQMRRSYNRRSPDQRVADIQNRIAELKAKQAAREKKDDPVLREIQKLLKRLKRFTQFALDKNRPDVANSTLGFKASLERILVSEMGSLGERQSAGDDEDDGE